MPLGYGRGRGKLGDPNFIRVDLEPVGQPGAEPSPRRRRRAGQPIKRNRVAVVIQQQQSSLLHEHSRDVIEPEIGTAE